MPKLNNAQWITIILIGALGVGLYFAPHKGALQQQKPVDRSVDVKINKALEILNEGNEPMKGILMLREVAEEHPDNIRAQFQLGLMSIRSGQFNKAIDRFTTVLALDPGYADAYFYRAHAHAGAGNKQNAKADFERVLENNPDNELRKQTEQYLTELKNN